MTKIGLLEPGSGSRAPKCDKNMKIIWTTYENNVIYNFHIIFICFIVFIFVSHFWPRDPHPGPKSHIFVIFLVIFFSYYFHIIVYAWAGPPVHTAIFEIWVGTDPLRGAGAAMGAWARVPSPQNVKRIWKYYEDNENHAISLFRERD